MFIFLKIGEFTVADNQNCLTQFELAIARKSNLFDVLFHETSHYIDLNSEEEGKKRNLESLVNQSSKMHLPFEIILCQFISLVIYTNICILVEQIT